MRGSFTLRDNAIVTNLLSAEATLYNVESIIERGGKMAAPLKYVSN